MILEEYIYICMYGVEKNCYEIISTFDTFLDVERQMR